MGLPMGLLREKSPKNRMNTGLFGSRSGEAGLTVLCRMKKIYLYSFIRHKYFYINYIYTNQYVKMVTDEQIY